MASPAPAPTGTCPKCKRANVKLMTNKFDAENHRTCPRCYNTAWAADKAKRTETANAKRAVTKAAKKKVVARPAPAAVVTASPTKAAKAPGAPKEPRQGLPVEDWPAAERAAAGRIAPSAIIPIPPTPAGLRLVFEVRIRPGMTPLEIMDLMRAVPSDAVVAG